MASAASTSTEVVETSKAPSTIAVKPKIFRQFDPLSIALGNLSKSLDRFAQIDQITRKAFVEEVTTLPNLINMNMPMLASVLILFESLPQLGNTQQESLILFLQQVTTKIPPPTISNVMPSNRTNQDIYDEISRPLLEDINDKNLTPPQINDILTKTKATIFRYAFTLLQFRDPDA